LRRASIDVHEKLAPSVAETTAKVGLLPLPSVWTRRLTPPASPPCKPLFRVDINLKRDYLKARELPDTPPDRRAPAATLGSTKGPPSLVSCILSLSAPRLPVFPDRPVKSLSGPLTRPSQFILKTICSLVNLEGALNFKQATT
jgi:hypothetical protein